MKNSATVKKIVVNGRTFLDPSEAPGYDPKTGTYRGRTENKTESAKMAQENSAR